MPEGNAIGNIIGYLAGVLAVQHGGHDLVRQIRHHVLILA